jgi:hypothetical protein
VDSFPTFNPAAVSKLDKKSDTASVVSDTRSKYSAASQGARSQGQASQSGWETKSGEISISDTRGIAIGGSNSSRKLVDKSMRELL